MFVHKKKNIFKKILLITLPLILIVGSGVVLYLRHWYTEALKPVSTDPAVSLIEISPGSSPKEISLQLKDAGIIRNSRAFETYIRGSGDAQKLKAGSYELSPSMSTQEVVSVLVQGKEASSLFTIAPGIRVDQIRKKLIDAGYAADSVDAALDPKTYSDISIISTLKPGSTLEGYIYPETFRVSVSSTPEDIIRQSLTELDKVLTDDMAQSFESKGLSIYEALTLASIIEKEVPSAEDRRVVAQIFLLRLENGIALGSDATYYYAAAAFGGEPFPTLDSPYNTRIYTGLPPGPINNVSRSSLEALANPSDTDYLFFVTGDDGVNHYTRTDAEHQEAVKRYCSTSCAPGYIPDSF